MYISESLPSCSRMPCIAEQRAERVAVGVLVRGEEQLVGRAQLADDLVLFGGDAHLVVVQKLGDAHAPVYRLVEDELKRRRALHAQLAWRPPAGDPVRGLEPGQRLRALLLAAEHANVHACLAQVGACFHSSHCHESYARVLEALRESRRDDLADRLVHPAHAVGHPREGLPWTPFGIPHARHQETSRST